VSGAGLSYSPAPNTFSEYRKPVMRIQYTAKLVALVSVTATLISCGGVKNPQLAMCQALVKDLSGSAVSEWNSVSENQTDRLHTVSIKYTSDAGSPGSIRCDYIHNQATGITETGPREVFHNGVKVETKDLIASAGRVTKDMLKQAAGLSASKATSLANDAVGAAKNAAKSLQ